VAGTIFSIDRDSAATIPAGKPFIPPKLIMQPVCKHPKVRVVAREDDVEYVECEECGEVFDADEYQEISQDGADELHLGEEDE
jgi:Zn ribbon nucleic-acid-binding protein